MKSQWISGLQTALSVWRLEFESELVYLGDAGTTTAGRPARRNGVEWSNRWTPGRHVVLDANLAWTTPRYVDALPSGTYIPNAVQKVANATLVLKNLRPWTVSVGIRYIGPAPLVENNTVRSTSNLTTNLRIARQWTREVEVSLDLLNVADRQNNDMSYLYVSRVNGEPTGVSGVHVHPAEPRAIRLNAQVKF